MVTTHVLGALLGLMLFASVGVGGQAAHGRYLVDGRVRVDLCTGADRLAGDLWWLDTVSGATGDARFSREASRLVVEWAPGLVGEARWLPDVAIVFSRAPWGADGRDTSLGLSLD